MVNGIGALAAVSGVFAAGSSMVGAQSGVTTIVANASLSRWEKRSFALEWAMRDLMRLERVLTQRALGDYIGVSSATIGDWKRKLTAAGTAPAIFSVFQKEERPKRDLRRLSEIERLVVLKEEIESVVVRLRKREAAVNLTTVARALSVSVPGLRSRMAHLRESGMWPEGMPEIFTLPKKRLKGKRGRSSGAKEGAVPLQGHQGGFSFREEMNIPKGGRRRSVAGAVASFEERIARGSEVAARQNGRHRLLEEAAEAIERRGREVTVESLAAELSRSVASVRAWVREAEEADILPLGFPNLR